MICSSVNLLRFMSLSVARKQTTRKVRAFQGIRSNIFVVLRQVVSDGEPRRFRSNKNMGRRPN